MDRKLETASEAGYGIKGRDGGLKTPEPRCKKSGINCDASPLEYTLGKPSQESCLILKNRAANS